MLIKSSYLKGANFVSVSLLEEENLFIITVDGVKWLETETKHHAIVLYELLKEHLTEYMTYEKIKN